LFSRRLDLLAFLGSALLSLALVAVGWPLGLVDGGGDGGADGGFDGARDTPPLVWLAVVVLVDVAHVWGNLLLVYADPVERRRRPVWWAGVPLASFVLAWALASEHETWLWRAVALLAVVHFVRQQVGWVKLYRARAGVADDDAAASAHAHAAAVGRVVDEGVVYAATIGPLVWWHAHLPRPFWWLSAGDFFVALPSWAGSLALLVECAFLLAYGVRSARAWRAGRGVAGRDIVVGTTALLWWLGIVACSSDYVFTVTNVLLHGVPYIVLIAVTARRRRQAGASVAAPLAHGAALIVGTLWACAWLEEAAWDRLLWHEHDAFFPLPAVDVGDARALVLALLVLPQVTHYVLDGLLWRRRDNPWVLPAGPASR
jgi:hypothetical protein